MLGNFPGQIVLVKAEKRAETRCPLEKAEEEVRGITTYFCSGSLLKEKIDSSMCFSVKRRIKFLLSWLQIMCGEKCMQRNAQLST